MSKNIANDTLNPHASLFLTRFASGGLAAIGFKAATATLQRSIERIENSSLLSNAKIISRSFLLGGIAMALGGVIEDFVAKGNSLSTF